MFIREKQVNGLPVLTLSGRLDIFAKNAFHEAMEMQKQKGIKKLFLDLRGVSLMDSVGLGALALAAKMFQDFQGTLILVNPQDQIKTLLENMNFSELLPILKTDDFSSFTKVS